MGISGILRAAIKYDARNAATPQQRAALVDDIVATLRAELDMTEPEARVLWRIAEISRRYRAEAATVRKPRPWLENSP